MAAKSKGPVADVKFAKIDADKAKRAAQKYTVEGYPTIYFFRHGVKHSYTGHIKRRHHIVGWLQVELKPDVEEISSVSNLPVTNRPVVVFRGSGPVRAMINGVARDTKHYADWYHLTSAPKDAQPSLDLLPPGESSPVTFEGAPDPAAITYWLRLALAQSEPIPESQVGAVHKVVTKTFDKDVLEATSHVMLEVYAPWCGHCKDLEPIYEMFAQNMNKTNRNILVARLDGTANQLLHVHWEVKGYPVVFHLKPGEAKPTRVSARTLETLEGYVNKAGIGYKPAKPAEGQPQTLDDLLGGFQSQEIPADSPGSDVVTVVLKNFVSKVFREEGGTVLELYSPECPICKKIESDYEAFATLMKRERPDLTVAKLDTTKNDVPFDGFDTQGVPVLFYIPKGEKKPEKSFLGVNCVDDMHQFLERVPVHDEL